MGISPLATLGDKVVVFRRNVKGDEMRLELTLWRGRIWIPSHPEVGNNLI